MAVPPEKPKVLVVDDNAANRALAQATLEDEGCEVFLAESGEAAIRSFEAHAPDCLLLDVRMPGMDGFEVCARIRSLPGGRETPVLFLTALRDVDTFDHALCVGGDDFLTKPVRPTELVIRVQTALKLRRTSEELRETYALVRKQRDDLMRLQLQKERLSAFVVHDLKNPVNALDLHAQVLLRDTELPERSRHSVEQIREQARALLRLVLNLLDISKSEEGQLVVRGTPLDLDAIVSEVLEAFEVKARAAQVSFERSLAVKTLHADQDLVRRVIENLIDNALRHAPPRSTIGVAVVAVAGGLELRVSDAGTGVAPEMREKIFDRFVQADSGERLVARSGRGLGLAFCKLVAEAHGGTIRLEDTVRGAVFCVSFPNQASPSAGR